MSTVLEGCARGYERTQAAIEQRVMRKYQKLSETELMPSCDLIGLKKKKKKLNQAKIMYKDKEMRI